MTTPPQTPNAGIYSVPVPAADLEAVYELLASRVRQRASRNTARENTPPESSDIAKRTVLKNDTWTKERLVQLSESKAVSIKVLAEIMDFLSQHTNKAEGFTRPEIAPHLSVNQGRFTIAFTKWSKHFEKNYGGIHTWPIVGETDNDEGLTRYLLSPEIAEQWRTIRSL